MDNLLNKISIKDLRYQLKSNSIYKNDDMIISSDTVEYINFLKERTYKFDAYMFNVCIGGIYRIKVDSKEYKVYNNMLFFSTPENVLQLEEVMEQKDLKIYTIIVSYDFLKRLNIPYQDLMDLYIKVKNHPCLSIDTKEIVYILDMFKLTENKEKYYNGIYKNKIIEGLLSAFLYTIFDILNKFTDTTSSGNSLNSRQEKVFKDFINLLKTNFQSERSVKFYAEKLCITPKYLSTLVKKVSGKTALEWIDNFVILESKNMLAYTQNTIQEIANNLNFNNQSFFAKYFKHHTNMTPREYRNKIVV